MNLFLGSYPTLTPNPAVQGRGMQYTVYISSHPPRHVHLTL